MNTKSKKLLYTIIAIPIATLLITFFVNLFIYLNTEKLIHDNLNAKDRDIALVLGCAAYDGVPSEMLKERLDKAIKLYKDKKIKKIIMSGDNGTENYNEVAAMIKYATENGVSLDDIYPDYAGFSTYESIYRAKEIFSTKSLVIITQKYHLYRAIYIAKSFGIDAVGVNSGNYKFQNQGYRDFREIFARVKDFATSIYKPEPTFLGEKISLDKVYPDW